MRFQDSRSYLIPLSLEQPLRIATDILGPQPDNPSAQKLRTKGGAAHGEDHLLAGSSPMWSPGLFLWSGVERVQTHLPPSCDVCSKCLWNKCVKEQDTAMSLEEHS